MRYPASLPAEEQSALCLRAKAGDRAASDRLVLTSMGFVHKRAAWYARRSGSADLIEDYVQDGVGGLLHAIGKFDPSFGVVFLSYAVHWINQSILAHGVALELGVPSSVIGTRRRDLIAYRKARRAGLEHAPALALVAEAHKSTVETVGAVIRALVGHHRTFSLDEPIGGEEDGATRVDVLPAPDGDLEADLDRERLRRDLGIDRFRAQLSPREVAILAERICADEPVTLQQIGDRFGVSRQRIMQVETKLRDKLRTHLSGTDSGRDYAERCA